MIFDQDVVSLKSIFPSGDPRRSVHSPIRKYRNLHRFQQLVFTDDTFSTAMKSVPSRAFSKTQLCDENRQ